MYRLTARLLLVLLLVGSLAPVALAISTSPPHACCMRKPLQGHGSRSLEVRPDSKEYRSCCPPVTTAHWAELGSGSNAAIHLLSASLTAEMSPVFRGNSVNSLHFVRGPPLS